MRKKPKTFNEYQKFTWSTRIYPPEQGIVYNTFGLAGETGEICEKLKKLIRDKNRNLNSLSSAEKLEIAKELGDVQWYLATLAKELGFTLQKIININYEKLTSREKRNKLKGSGDSR